jgi:hypothetical protein
MTDISVRDGKPVIMLSIQYVLEILTASKLRGRRVADDLYSYRLNWLGFLACQVLTVPLSAYWLLINNCLRIL